MTQRPRSLWTSRATTSTFDPSLQPVPFQLIRPIPVAATDFPLSLLALSLLATLVVAGGAEGETTITIGRG